MGYIKPNPIFLSVQDIVMETGKITKRIWKDVTMNSIISRMDEQ